MRSKVNGGQTQERVVVERFSTGGGFNSSGSKPSKKNSPGGLYNVNPDKQLQLQNIIS